MYINLGVLFFLILAVVLAHSGYKKGAVKSVVSLISLLIAGIVGVIVTYGVRNYISHNVIGVAVVVILLLVVGVITKVLNVIFFSAKVISALPVVGLINHLLGIVLGIVEAVVFYWVLCVVLCYIPMGEATDFILKQISTSAFLSDLYNLNPLFYVLNIFGAKVDEYSAVLKPFMEIIDKFDSVKNS